MDERGLRVGIDVVTLAALSSFGRPLSGPALVALRSAELCARSAPMVDALNVCMRKGARLSKGTSTALLIETLSARWSRI